MDIDKSITHLIGMARGGRDEAFEQLWSIYFLQLVTVARRKIDTASREMVDEEDLALSAFKSFWNGIRNDRFPHLTDRTSLWPLLVAITKNKCIDHVRHEGRKKRGGNARKLKGIDEIVSRTPDPELVCELTDQLDHLLDCLDKTGDSSLRRVAELRLHGYSVSELADSLACARRTVERKLALIERCWATEVADEFDE